ncbi:hypothetical protein AB0D14_25720 [Streptomyces sp. NPDC048484]|uniref:hypothetical protein n=1 Tax=Streptomyces sp. NPDC048484 TaxID=3155146 RepID=UPI00343D323B
MEQRIGPNIPPLQGAAIDPAFVPGITGPRPAEPDGAKPKETEPETESPETAEETAAQEAASEVPVSKDSVSKGSVAKEEPETEASDEKSADAKPSNEKPSDEKPEESEGSEAEAPEGGPVFEASDRRAKILADHRGVRLSLDDQEAEFRWDEIGAVETESPRFGKRFTITVHTADRRWYPLEIEATARSRFQEWETGLDEVLDTYFEDDAEAEPAEESAP